MNIRSKDRTIRALFEGEFFEIPRYQRPYSWERIHLEEFWKDTVQSRSDEDYFIGSVVVYKESKNDTLYHIVDGQQRLTTITIFLCALRDALEQEGHNELADGLDTLIRRKNLSAQMQYVLHPDSSYPFFQEHIQKRGTAEVQVAPGPEERALAAAQAFAREQIAMVVAAAKDGPTTAAHRRNTRAALELNRYSRSCDSSRLAA